MGSFNGYNRPRKSLAKHKFLYSDVSYSEYSEKDEADYIKVYDWNGKHLEDLVLPFAVSRIIATENLLYCIKQDVDKVVIYTFGLDNIA